LTGTGALTHRIGKVHEVGLFTLKRQPDGTLKRESTPLVKQFKEAVAASEQRVGALEKLGVPVPGIDEQLPPLEYVGQPLDSDLAVARPVAKPQAASGNGNGHGTKTASRLADAAPGLGSEPSVTIESAKSSIETKPPINTASSSSPTCAGASCGSARSSSSRASPRSTRSSSSKSPSSTSPKAPSRASTITGSCPT
jgi:hypothetical protein